MHRFTSWYTVEIPAAWASAVPRKPAACGDETVPSSMYTPVTP